MGPWLLGLGSLGMGGAGAYAIRDELKNQWAKFTSPNETPEDKQRREAEDANAAMRIRQRTGVENGQVERIPASSPEVANPAPITFTKDQFRQFAGFGPSVPDAPLKMPVQVAEEHMKEQLDPSSAGQDVAPYTEPLDINTFNKHLATLTRGTGTDPSSPTAVTDMIGAMQQSSPDSFNDIQQALREVSGFQGDIATGAKKAQEMLGVMQQTASDRQSLLERTKALQGNSEVDKTAAESRAHIADLRGKTQGTLEEVVGSETEAWRQMLHKLQHGGSKVDNFGFALLAMVPILAKMVNKNANVGAAYQALGKGYQDAQAQAAQERREALAEFNTLSSQVKQGAVALNTVGINLVNVEQAIAKDMDANRQGLMQDEAKILNDMDSSSTAQGSLGLAVDKNERDQLDFIKKNRENNDFYLRNGVDISAVDDKAQEKIGKSLREKKLISKMEKLEAQVMRDVSSGKITQDQLDNIAEYADENGIMKIDRGVLEQYTRNAPYMLDYINTANELISSELSRLGPNTSRDAAREIAKQYTFLGGGMSLQTLDALQKQRRGKFNAGLMELTGPAAAKARVDNLITQFPGGGDGLVKTINALGGKVDLKRGMVWDIRVDTPNGSGYKKMTIEDFVELYKKINPNVQVDTQLMFDEGV